MDELIKIKILNQELELENKILKEKVKPNLELINKNSELENKNKELQCELDKIKYSRSYKLIQKIKRILKRG